MRSHCAEWREAVLSPKILHECRVYYNVRDRVASDTPVVPAGVDAPGGSDLESDQDLDLLITNETECRHPRGPTSRLFHTSPAGVPLQSRQLTPSPLCVLVWIKTDGGCLALLFALRV